MEECHGFFTKEQRKRIEMEAPLREKIRRENMPWEDYKRLYAKEHLKLTKSLKRLEEEKEDREGSECVRMDLESLEGGSVTKSKGKTNR